jgi:hypothetical protein
VALTDELWPGARGWSFRWLATVGTFLALPNAAPKFRVGMSTSEVELRIWNLDIRTSTFALPSFSNDFHENALLALSVKLTIEDLLPWPEIELAPRNRN